jgi:hypothetical protein
LRIIDVKVWKSDGCELKIQCGSLRVPELISWIILPLEKPAVANVNPEVRRTLAPVSVYRFTRACVPELYKPELIIRLFLIATSYPIICGINPCLLFNL